MIQLDPLLGNAPATTPADGANPIAAGAPAGFDPLLARLFESLGLAGDVDAPEPETPEDVPAEATSVPGDALLPEIPLPRLAAGFVERGNATEEAQTELAAAARLRNAPLLGTAGEDGRIPDAPRVEDASRALQALREAAVAEDPTAPATPRGTPAAPEEPAAELRPFASRVAAPAQNVPDAPARETPPALDTSTLRARSATAATERGAAPADRPELPLAPPLPSGTEGVRTAGSTPGTPDLGVVAGTPSSAPVSASGPVERVVPTQIEWLAERGGGRARVRLDPPALGELDIAVRVRGDRVDVRIQADQAGAHQLLTDSVERLSEALVQRELRVEGLEIRSSSDSAASRDAFAGQPDSHSTGQDADARERRPSAARVPSAGTPGQADSTPNDTAAPKASGIDLRV